MHRAGHGVTVITTERRELDVAIYNQSYIQVHFWSLWKSQIKNVHLGFHSARFLQDGIRLFNATVTILDQIRLENEILDFDGETSHYKGYKNCEIEIEIWERKKRYTKYGG